MRISDWSSDVCSSDLIEYPSESEQSSRHSRCWYSQANSTWRMPRSRFQSRSTSQPDRVALVDQDLVLPYAYNSPLGTRYDSVYATPLDHKPPRRDIYNE